MKRFTAPSSFQRASMPPGTSDDVADDIQASVKEVVGARNDDDRQFQRLGPGQHVGERHCLVGRAMDDDRVVGDRSCCILARALDVAGGGTDQYQSLRWVIGRSQRLGNARLHVGAVRAGGSR